MEKVRRRIEDLYGRLAENIFDHRFIWLIVLIVLLAIPIRHLPEITLDTSTEGFLHENDPALKTYNEFRDQFGRDDVIVIALEPESVFDIDFLTKLRSLHEELEDNVPYLDDITSLVNARHTLGRESELVVEDLLEELPRNDEELERLKEKVLSHPLYPNLIVSEDGRFTSIVLRSVSYSTEGREQDLLGGFDTPAAEPETPAAEKEFLTDEENQEMVQKTKAVLEQADLAGIKTYLSGTPVITNELKQNMMKDMQGFMRLAIVMIVVVMFALFRRASGVLMPLLVVILSLLATVGLMAWTGTAIKLPTQILPSLLLAVGVGETVHLLALFYKRLDESGDKREAMVYAVGHSGLPIMMTALTTAVGFSSFAFATVAPIADLGFFASAGVMIAFFLTMTLIPTLAAIFPIKHKPHHADEDGIHQRTDNFLIWVADWSSTHPRSIVGVSFLLIAISLVFALQLRFSHNPLKWFPEDMTIRTATEAIDKHLKGATAFEVIVDTGEENGLYEPDVLNRIDGMKQEMEAINRPEIFVGKVMALTDILKETNQALNENRPDYYAIPQDKPLIAQEFLLFENSGSDDLEDMVDTTFQKTRITHKLPWVDALTYGAFIEEMEARYHKAFGDTAEVTVTGIVTLLGRTLTATIHSAAQSYLVAFALITLMMILLIGNVRLGLVSMIPNLTPIILAMGLMKVVGIPLDMFTMLIGSIAIGLAVDDTVHFMHNFKKYYHRHADVTKAVEETFLTAGRAMLVTTIVLAVGFFIFMFSFMSNIWAFGLLTGITIIIALLADFLLAPALMQIMEDKGWINAETIED